MSSTETRRQTPDFQTVPIGGFHTVAATAAQFVDRMVADCFAARVARDAGRPLAPKLVFSSNGQGISLAGVDKEFAAVMDAADFVHADGMSVVFASRLVSRTPLPERIATTDFFHDAARAAEAEKLRFFMLGGSEDQNADACEAIKRTYPGVILVGRRNGYFKREEEAAICAEIVATKPDVLWVAMGKPAQEYWCARNRDRLAGVGWIKTCGGLYAFLAGHASRAPQWMQKAGMEWVWRLMQEPGRLAWRYFVTNPHAIYLMLKPTPADRRVKSEALGQ